MSEKIGACRDKLCTLIHLLRLPLTSSLPRPFAYSQIKRRFSSHLQRSFPSKYSLTGFSPLFTIAFPLHNRGALYEIRKQRMLRSELKGYAHWDVNMFHFFRERTEIFLFAIYCEQSPFCL